MSIHFISGKPGGGKTLYSVRLIVDEILNGHRPIVTNVSLKLGELNKYLQDKYPTQYDRVFGSHRHISQLVTLLTEDDLPEFFTFRGEGVRLQGVSNDEWKQGKRPNFKDVSDAGIFYVLDEIHVAFNSRSWASTGAQVLYYLSQHRKLGDDVICITQSVGNVDKQFRSVAQDFTYIKNLAKQRAGLFRLPSIFARSTYAQPATDNSVAMESGTFTLDMTGLASVYDTAKGVGIHGRAGADTNARKKGLHWLWFVIGLPLLAYFILHWVPILLSHKLGPQKPVVPVPVHRTDFQPSPLPVAMPPVPSAPPSAPSPLVVTQYVQQAVQSDEKDLFCVGYYGQGNDYTIFLSDGSTVMTASGRVQRLEKGFVTVDNVKLPIKRVEPHYAGSPSRVDMDAYGSPVEPQPILPRLPFGGVVVTPSIGGVH